MLMQLWGLRYVRDVIRNTFRQLVPLLSSEDVLLLMRRNLCTSCVHSLCYSETTPVKKENEKQKEFKLQQVEMRMIIIRWTCGVYVKES